MSLLGKRTKKNLIKRRKTFEESSSVADSKPSEMKNNQFETEGEIEMKSPQGPKNTGKLKRRMENKKERGSQDEVDHSSLEIERLPKKIQDKLKKPTKKKRKDRNLPGSLRSLEKNENIDQNDVYNISSGDEDASKGMKKWLTDYHQSRPGLKVLQERIDDFLSAHEAQVEQKRKEMEDQTKADGWTVVVRNKGRKKTTDVESGTTVGFVAQAAAEHNMAKKKKKEVGSNFYRFQRREAQRNEILMLQGKFEEDKKRIQQLRATRKFRPY